MAYNNNIPQSTDAQDTSQPQLLANFQAISTLIGVNHVNFDDPSGDQGKHNFVTFPAQISTPAVLLNEVVQYGAVSALTSQAEMFVTKFSGSNIPFTAMDISANGWTYLPSGLLLKWGTSTANGSTVFSFPVSASIPVFTGILSMQVSTVGAGITDTDTFVRISSYTTTTLTIYGSARSTVTTAACSFNYLAIGY